MAKNIQNRLDFIVSKELAKNIIPLKTEKGILVGDVLIVNEGNIKHIIRNNELIYKDISLNATAIKLANMLATDRMSIKIDQIYSADQEYGRWFVDSQMLRAQYQKYLNNSDFERADNAWARYQESRERALNAKKYVESLISI
jgi:hypothetical protein